MPVLTDERVATLISSVTHKLLGIRFGLAPRGEIPSALSWRAAVIDIGERTLSVALSSDPRGCTALGAAFFDVTEAAVNIAIINDSLAELVNISAGQLKMALRIDKALGLPRIVEGPERPGSGRLRVIRLRGDNALEILVWITDHDSTKHGAAR
jgi:hypothetical protein